MQKIARQMTALMVTMALLLSMIGMTAATEVTDPDDYVAPATTAASTDPTDELTDPGADPATNGSGEDAVLEDGIDPDVIAGDEDESGQQAADGADVGDLPDGGMPEVKEEAGSSNNSTIMEDAGTSEAVTDTARLDQTVTDEDETATDVIASGTEETVVPPENATPEEKPTLQLGEGVMGGKPVVEIDDEIIVIDENLEPATFDLGNRNAEYFDPTDLVNAATAPTTYQEVYDRIMALQEKYPEGLTWTNYTPYGNSGPLGDSYTWRGGRIAGNITGGVGCAAFTFILSDVGFGGLPARTITPGSAEFTFENVRVGDILRIYGNSHSVIVIKKSATGVIVAEANFNSSVHWGRALSEAEVMAADFIITRYPENFKPDDAADVDEVLDSGTEGAANWSLTKGGVLTISGSGAIPDYSPNDGQAPAWSTYSSEIDTVVIEKGITRIGDYAFYQSKAMTVYLPDTITGIGQSSFRGASILAVTIPGAVKTIGDDAFHGCTNLTSATIADGVVTIGERAFESCTSLTHVDFPASITTVGAGAFASCSKVVQVRFMPGSTKVQMGDNLFSQCWNLMSVTLPAGADCISAGMFASCKMLCELYIPAGVTEVKGVGELSGAPFSGCTALAKIDFGGDEGTWNRIGGDSALTYSGLTKTKVNFNVEFDDPFATDPDDPGDLPPTENLPGEDDPCKDGHTGTADANGNCTVCGKPIAVNPPVVVPPVPSDHEHSWSTEWNYDETHHWHECGNADCTVTAASEKDGYAAHSYGEWVIDTAATASQSGSRHRDCTICAARQTEVIPATGGSSGGNSGGSSGGSSGSSGSSGGGSGGSSSSNSPTTTRNPDGSTTTVTTDKTTGIKTETTKKPDGSSVVVETQKNGTVTTTTTDVNGKSNVNVALSNAAINTAGQRGEAVTLPIPAVRVTQEAMAPIITISTENKAAAKVSIPVLNPTASTVVAITKVDGTTEIVKTAVPTIDSMVATLPSGATVKIIDNKKDFADVTTGAWSEEAINFVAARGLFAGTSESTFAPNLPMNRAMLMTVLARLDGAELAGGATWYEKSTEWAIAHDISDGTNPTGNVTREQLVTMIWRYMGSPTAAGSLSEYADASVISEYAQDAMCWAVEHDIIAGFNDGRLAAQEETSRAQVAQILKNLIENMTLG